MLLYNKLARETILKIYNFVIKTREKEKIGQRRLMKLVKENFGIDFSENTIAGWVYKKSVPFENEKTQFKPKLKPLKCKLYNDYIKKEISSQRLAKKYNVSSATVINWIKSHNLPTRTHKESMNTLNIKKELRELKLIKPPKNYNKLSIEKAYLLGVLCGDAYIRKDCLSLEIRYDKEFIEKFVEYIKKVYGVEYNYHFYKPNSSYRCFIGAETICKDLLKYGEFKTECWNVPREILYANNQQVISNFLRGLFDSEGSVGKYCVDMSSINHKALKNVKKLLIKFGIKSYLSTKYHKLYITKKENIKKFREKINFTIIRKKLKLDDTTWKNDSVSK